MLINVINDDVEKIDDFLLKAELSDLAFSIWDASKGSAKSFASFIFKHYGYLFSLYYTEETLADDLAKRL